MSRIFLLLLLAVGVFADCYGHNPRTSNNRLNERSANRNNGDRLFDSQNNNRGGYNVGDKTDAAFDANNPERSPATTFNYLDNTAQQYQTMYLDGSVITTEWTLQHGCGGNEATDPYKLNCNVVLQFTCDAATAANVWVAKNTAGVAQTLPEDLTRILEVQLRDGGNTNTPDKANSYADIPTQTANNKANQRGTHESTGFYYDCEKRLRNNGLFHADQNLNGPNARFTRQNNNGNRRGLECPEERDYYPYWGPSIWVDIAYLTDHTEFCDSIKAQSQNLVGFSYCSGVLVTDGQPPITEAACTAIAGAKWLNLSRKKTWPAPECLQAEWSRVNHLGNGRNGQPHHYNWTLPTWADLIDAGFATTDAEYVRCAYRLRYNMTTDDYDPQNANSTMDEKENAGVVSPVTNNPTIDVGLETLQGLRLAVNTAQYGRTFQDRSHVFYISKRPTDLATGKIVNLNVRGKRGNIVQTFPSVEYDFMPNRLHIDTDSYIHLQWTGSNTHNNGEPAGDGQAGDAGEGTGGTDRHNFVILRAPSENYPLPLDKVADADNLWKQVNCWAKGYGASPAWTKLAAANWVDCALIAATSGKYRSTTAVTADTNAFDPLLNNAPASLVGGMVLQFQTSAKGKTFDYMCTRNNNFSNRSQKGSIVVV